VYHLLRPLLFTLPAETAHNLAIAGLSSGLYPAQSQPDYPALHTEIAGLRFKNPIGLAAGFDKNAQCLSALSRQGFGFVEVGTVTPKPQPGNPQPRLFRLEEDEAVINRFGFNNKGAEYFKNQLSAHPKSSVLVGANIGKNKTSEDPIADYIYLLQELYGLSDYITVNISSPNTPGLRGLQAREPLNTLLAALMETRLSLAKKQGSTVPLFLKIAPDLSREDEETIVELSLAHQIAALIISNTTITRPETLQSRHRSETGGLSGKPLFEASTALLKRIYALSAGKLPLIGVGGVDSAETAYAKFTAGASLVQVYSALVYQGFGLVAEILEGLNQRLAADGVKNVREVVGKEVK
jgi:dihydroorotate dehydrogenase